MEHRPSYHKIHNGIAQKQLSPVNLENYKLGDRCDYEFSKDAETKERVNHYAPAKGISRRGVIPMSINTNIETPQSPNRHFSYGNLQTPIYYGQHPEKYTTGRFRDVSSGHVNRPARYSPYVVDSLSASDYYRTLINKPYPFSTFTYKQHRRRHKKHELELLEKVFAKNPLPSKETKLMICKLTGLSQKNVQIWFQNKRQKMRRLGENKDNNESTRTNDDSVSIPKKDENIVTTPNASNTLEDGGDDQPHSGLGLKLPSISDLFMDVDLPRFEKNTSAHRRYSDVTSDSGNDVTLKPYIKRHTSYYTSTFDSDHRAPSHGRKKSSTSTLSPTSPENHNTLFHYDYSGYSRVNLHDPRTTYNPKRSLSFVAPLSKPQNPEYNYHRIRGETEGVDSYDPYHYYNDHYNATTNHNSDSAYSTLGSGGGYNSQNKHPEESECEPSFHLKSVLFD
ncbi:Regulatory protein PHO2 [Zancudomyces culisetae]|uniref:Regulatory protein PHO2 n=1 Tax=Zancudomyces culisetae TaxID=1213189 RepID=A0A1R1PPE4_ZANCU|nr:Regulatory protein PHO2 [Zancudomyces culisetae]|eukprot:OMH82834.1 Regulatory protein PHO2 [Zancudomyces culisetae]